MNVLYSVLQMSKQAFHDRLNTHIRKQEELEQMLPLLRNIRQDHPKMSSRHIYIMIRPQTIGRDRFEAFCFERGLKVEVKRCFKRTTNSLGVTRFENHLLNLELTHVNQVWVSDITYYEINNRFYYLTFIMDLYSRTIVGYSVSENLFTENTTLMALKMALKVRQGCNLKGLIIHSDGGGQYYSKEFLAITKDMVNSMCESVYENIHAERINGTIKNQYLEGYKPANFEELKKMTTKAVNMYNRYKPHKSLSGLTPLAFESLEIGLSTEITLANKRKKEAKKEKLLQKQLTYS